MNTTRNKQLEVDRILEIINDYLSNAGWTINSRTLQFVDPVTRNSFYTMTAFDIQTSRDLDSKDLN